MIELTTNARGWSAMEFTSEVEPTRIVATRSMKWADRIQVGDVIPVARTTKNGKRIWKVDMRVTSMKIRKDSVGVTLEAV